MGFVQEEEDEETTVGEECYESDSDDDVDRYVFLARQPAPAAEASSDDDDGDDEDGAAPDGGGGRGGGRGRKRLLRDMLDAPALPSKVKKARLDHLMTTTLAPSRTSGLKAVEAQSEEAADRGKNRKCGRCCGGKLQVQRAARGKRSNREASGEEESRRDGHAMAVASGAGASTDRFACNICERCFGSHQALGGHVRGHTKRAKHDVAGAIRKEKTAGALTSAVAASRNRVGFNSNGNSESEDDVIGSGHERTTGNSKSEDDVIGSGHDRTTGNGRIGAGNHVDHDGDGNVEEDEKAVSAPSDRCTDGNGTGKKKKKVAVRRCYVFLARQPSPAAEASSDDDDDEDCAVPDRGGGGGGRGRKRLLHEMLDAPALPSKVTKARLDHLTTTLAPSRKAAEAGSEEAVRLPDRGKNKNHGRYGGGKLQVQSTACGKRSRVPDRHATTATAVPSAAGASTNRFVCNLCERCFGSHQALGGHVRGHTKRAKHDVAGAIHKEKTTGALTSAVAANSNRVGFNGSGNNESEDDMIGAGHERTTGNGRNEEEMAIGAGNHVDHDGDGNVDEDETAGAAAPSDRSTDGNGTGKRKKKNKKKVAVRRCHKLATGNANKVAREAEHTCELCGMEFLSGQALGGHMSKHRTRPGHGGEG